MSNSFRYLKFKIYDLGSQITNDLRLQYMKSWGHTAKIMGRTSFGLGYHSLADFSLNMRWLTCHIRLNTYFIPKCKLVLNKATKKTYTPRQAYHVAVAYVVAILYLFGVWWHGTWCLLGLRHGLHLSLWKLLDFDRWLM